MYSIVGKINFVEMKYCSNNMILVYHIVTEKWLESFLCTYFLNYIREILMYGVHYPTVSICTGHQKASQILAANRTFL